MYKICLVEDEIDLSNLIKKYLEHEGFEVTQFFNGNDAMNSVGEIKADLWILDIMLGDDISGYDVIKKVKQNDNEVPVIFTSARDQDIDRIIGLELGSDDYLVKPYSTKELVLRTKKLLERIYAKKNNILRYDDYVIDLDRRSVNDIKNEIKLTTLEFDLLVMFLNNRNRSFSREEILTSIWGNDYFGSDRVVDDLLRRLRKKMNKLNIDTVYGYGYRLN